MAECNWNYVELRFGWDGDPAEIVESNQDGSWFATHDGQSTADLAAAFGLKKLPVGATLKVKTTDPIPGLFVVTGPNRSGPAHDCWIEYKAGEKRPALVVDVLVGRELLSSSKADGVLARQKTREEANKAAYREYVNG